MTAHARGTDPDDSSTSSFAEMRSRYLVDTGHWRDEVARWRLDGTDEVLISQMTDEFTTGLAAAKTGDLTRARTALGEVRRLLSQAPLAFNRAGIPQGDPTRRLPDVEVLQLEAVILSATGQRDQAAAKLQQAIPINKELPYAFGPPTPAKPCEELLGELLLGGHKSSLARAAFEASLKRAPERTQSLLGLARAGKGDGR